MALADDRQRLLDKLTGPDGVIDRKLKGLVFPIWRARQHLAEYLLLQYARVRCPVSVIRDWTPYRIKEEVTKVPHS